MILGLFKRGAKVVKVTRKKKTEKVVKPKVKKLKTKKAKVRRKIARPKRKPAIKKVKRGLRPAKKMPQVAGKVTHYFPHVKAGVILVTKGTIALGDTLQIKGHSTDFKQKIASMQINNVAINQAKPGQEIGLLVKSRVRHNDVVYKI